MINTDFYIHRDVKQFSDSIKNRIEREIDSAKNSLTSYFNELIILQKNIIS